MVDNAISHNTNVLTTFGAKSNRIERSQERHREIKFYTEKIISKNEDIDMEQAIIDYKVLQNNYMASLRVGAQIVKPTLMDFLR
jgi:flagellar hook-associated protein 3 FlgL